MGLSVMSHGCAKVIVVVHSEQQLGQMRRGLMTVHTRHNTEEIGRLSVEVFGNSIHLLSV